MASDDVIFVKYVPPACDEEIILIPFIDLTRSPVTWVPDSPMSPLTPVWVDQWEDLDDDKSGDYKP